MCGTPVNNDENICDVLKAPPTPGSPLPLSSAHPTCMAPCKLARRVVQCAGHAACLLSRLSVLELLCRVA